MDEQRIRDYLYLIQELIRCSSDNEKNVLKERPGLLDAGLVEMMKKMAAVETDRDTTNRLSTLIGLVEEKLNLPSGGDREKSLNKDKLNFLFEVLKATRDSQGNPQVVYPILQTNLAKLDDNFATVLSTWATAKFSEVGLQQAQRIASRHCLFTQKKDFPFTGQIFRLHKRRIPLRVGNDSEYLRLCLLSES